MKGPAGIPVGPFFVITLKQNPKTKCLTTEVHRGTQRKSIIYFRFGTGEHPLPVFLCVLCGQAFDSSRT
jgi:hypothetical protein